MIVMINMIQIGKTSKKRGFFLELLSSGRQTPHSILKFIKNLVFCPKEAITTASVGVGIEMQSLHKLSIINYRAIAEDLRSNWRIVFRVIAEKLKASKVVKQLQKF